MLEKSGRMMLNLEPLEGRILLSGTYAYSLEALASFDGTAGSNPLGDLVMYGGNLYGTAGSGGDSNGDGTVFEIAAGGHTITTLASFNGTNGSEPLGGLIVDGQGNLYGTTTHGGANGYGTVFEIASGSNTITTLASFDGTNGADPRGLIMDNGNLYGVATYGIGNEGTVFEIASGSNTITTLAAFDGTNGAQPQGDLVMVGGNLYGTTMGGGDSGDGTVFELASGSNTVTTLASFDGTNGSSPQAGLIMAGGNLYGTTAGGGDSSDGTVFEVVSGSSTITTLASFDGTNGSAPSGGLIMADGNLYGTAAEGAGGDGTVFELPSGSNTITTLAKFDETNGAEPWSNLVMDGNGNLYGTALIGGANGDGVVFELSPATQLAFDQQPTGAQGGSTLSPAVTVDVEDVNGNLVPTDTSSVTLTISSGTLNGTLTEQAVNGVATFSDLSVPAAGRYTLQATDGSLQPATSDQFVVSPAPIGSFDSPDGQAHVLVYDVAAPLDVSMSNIKVKWGKDDSVRSITLGGRQAMGGLGLAIEGASSVGHIKDHRHGDLAKAAFLVSNAPIKSVRLKSGMTGYDLNGVTLGTLTLPQDIDGDGSTADTSAIYTEGSVGKMHFRGDVSGDVYIGGDFGAFTSKRGSLNGDFTSTGGGRKLEFRGDFASTVKVEGSLRAFHLRGGNFEGALNVTGNLDKLLVTNGGDFAGGGEVYVGGLLQEGRIGSFDTSDNGQAFGIYAGKFGKIGLGTLNLRSKDLPFDRGDLRVEVNTR